MAETRVPANPTGTANTTDTAGTAHTANTARTAHTAHAAHAVPGTPPHVGDIRAPEQHLTAAFNTRWVRAVEKVDESAMLGTLEDPDGTYVQIVEVTADLPGT